MSDSLHYFAQRFYEAFYSRDLKRQGGYDVSTLSIEEAYEVQRLVAQKRTQSGEQIVGYKVGCTSKAIQRQFGLKEPICGRLFHPHVSNEGLIIDWADFANCAIEPEMVFRIGCDLVGEDLTDQDLIDSIEYVSPGVEVHHFKFWYGTPTLQELICSGGIHAGLIVGESRVAPSTLHFKDEVFSVYLDSKLVAAAPAWEILGGPLQSLRWLVEFLSKRNEVLKKGAYVIPGSPTELIEIKRDTDLKISIDGVGEVPVTFRSNQNENSFKC